MVGLNFRALLDGGLRANLRDLKLYEYRNNLITELENRICEYPWLELSDGTIYTKTFVPGKISTKTFKERLLAHVEHELAHRNHRDTETYSWLMHFKKMIEEIPEHKEL